MFVLGLVLLLVGWLLAINILFVIGVVLLIVGLCLFGLGYVGHPVGGRAHWF